MKLAENSNLRKGKFEVFVSSYQRIANLCTLGNYSKAKKQYLDRIGSQDTVLIVGGGTGSILNELNAKAIHFVEPSTNMISKAKKVSATCFVEFYPRSYPIRTLNATQFDWIILPYYLDLYTDKELPLILTSLQKQLKPTGTLWVIDFNPPQNVWQKIWLLITLKIHQWIFKLPKYALPAITKKLQPQFQLKEAKLFFGKFIFSSLWGKT